MQVIDVDDVGGVCKLMVKGVQDLPVQPLQPKRVIGFTIEPPSRDQKLGALVTPEDDGTGGTPTDVISSAKIFGTACTSSDTPQVEDSPPIVPNPLPTVLSNSLPTPFPTSQPHSELTMNTEMPPPPSSSFSSSRVPVPAPMPTYLAEAAGKLKHAERLRLASFKASTRAARKMLELAVKERQSARESFSVAASVPAGVAAATAATTTTASVAALSAAAARSAAGTAADADKRKGADDMLSVGSDGGSPWGCIALAVIELMRGITR